MGKFIETILNLLILIAVILFFGAVVVLLIQAFSLKAYILIPCAVVVFCFGFPTVGRLVGKE